jgi:putative oxidoreductase
MKSRGMFLLVRLRILDVLNEIGHFLAPLGLRILLAWEFWEAGKEKYHGTNWFGEIQEQFPLPFNLLPPEMSWQMAMWFELIGAIALLVGFGTRFFSFTLMILTLVATASVHWPAEWATWTELFQAGYDVCDNQGGNFKIPVMYLVMLLALLLTGPGKASLDYVIWRRLVKPNYYPHDIHK